MKPICEQYVHKALFQFSQGNDGDEVYHPLYKAWREFQRNPHQLKEIENLSDFGSGLMLFLSYNTVNDIDDKQQLASISYLFLSLAIQNDPTNINLYKNRLILIGMNREAFQYTVSSVVNNDGGFYGFFGIGGMGQFNARDSLYKMEFADLMQSPSLLSISMLKDRYDDLCQKININFFGENQSEEDVASAGEKLHTDVLNYLKEKVLTTFDLDF